MPLNVLLIRHGQSEWNATGRWQGQADPPLTDEGRNDARRAAEALGAFDAVVASTLQRAIETAEALADGIGVGPVLTDPRWMERTAGPWEGLTRPEIEAGWPGHLAEGGRPAGWEADEVLVTRARGVGRAVGPDVGRTSGGRDPFGPDHGGRATPGRTGRTPSQPGRPLGGGSCRRPLGARTPCAAHRRRHQPRGDRVAHAASVYRRSSPSSGTWLGGNPGLGGKAIGADHGPNAVGGISAAPPPALGVQFLQGGERAVHVGDVLFQSFKTFGHLADRRRTRPDRCARLAFTP